MPNPVQDQNQDVNNNLLDTNTAPQEAYNPEIVNTEPQAVQPQAVQPQPQATNITKVARRPQIADLSVEGIPEGDESLVVGNVNTTSLPQFPVERFKFQKGGLYLVAIPVDKVVAVRVHYEEKIGNYKCFGGICCTSKPPSVRYIYPMSMYEINSDLTVVSQKMRHFSLVVGAEYHLAIQDLFRNKTVYDSDVLIRCTDDKFQKLQIQGTGKPCIYLSNEKMVAQVEEFWNKHYKDITKPVFNIITEQELLQKRQELAGSVDVGTQSIPNINMEEVFNN